LDSFINVIIEESCSLATDFTLCVRADYVMRQGIYALVMDRKV